MVAQRERKAVCFFFITIGQWPFTIDREIIPRNGRMLSLLIQFIQWLHRHHLAHTPVVSILTPESIDWISFCTASVPLQFQAKMGGKTSNDFWTNLNIASNYDHKWANVRNVRLKRWKHKKSTRNKWKHASRMKMKMLRIFVICVLFPARWCNWAHHSQLAGKFYIVFTKTVNHPINRSINQTKSYQKRKAVFWA